MLIRRQPLHWWWDHSAFECVVLDPAGHTQRLALPSAWRAYDVRSAPGCGGAYLLASSAPDERAIWLVGADLVPRDHVDLPYCYDSAFVDSITFTGCWCAAPNISKDMARLVWWRPPGGLTRCAIGLPRRADVTAADLEAACEGYPSSDKRHITFRRPRFGTSPGGTPLGGTLCQLELPTGVLTDFGVPCDAVYAGHGGGVLVAQERLRSIAYIWVSNAGCQSPTLVVARPPGTPRPIVRVAPDERVVGFLVGGVVHAFDLRRGREVWRLTVGVGCEEWDWFCWS